MRPFPTGSSIATLLVAVAVAACSSATGGAAIPGAPPAPAAQPNPGAVAQARADSARYPYTSADIHFMSAMIGHHAQAIDMARLTPTHAASASVRTLAERIINAQQDEIATMQQWLRERRQPVPEVRAAGMTMVMNGVEHEHRMPGMLSETQMQQLDEARGAEFDRLFLTYMIQHHRGAVAMVEELFGSHGAGQDDIVFKFASDVNVDQITEIARMQRMLVALMVEGQSP